MTKLKLSNINRKTLSFLTGLSFLPVLPTRVEAVWVAAIFVLYFLKIALNVRRFDKTMLFFGLLAGFFALNMYVNTINDGDMSWTVLNLRCIACLLMVAYAYLKRDIGVIYAFVIGCNVWNLISFFDVMYKVLFTNYDSLSTLLLLCGYDNGLGAYLLPLMCLNVFFFYTGKNGIITLGSVLLSMIQIVAVWSVTSIVGVFLIALFGFAEFRFHITSKIRPWMMLLVNFFCFLFVIVLRIYDNALTRFLIVDVFHKTMDFSTRTNVWDRAMAYTALSPIWGHGRNAEYQRMLYGGVSSAHNFFLDIANQTGLVGVFLMTAFLIAFVVQIRKKDPRSVQLAANTMMIVLLVLQFESFCAYGGYPLLFVLFTFIIACRRFAFSQRKTKWVHFVWEKSGRRSA